jgi:hypothetical protein
MPRGEMFMRMNIGHMNISALSKVIMIETTIVMMRGELFMQKHEVCLY